MFNMSDISIVCKLLDINLIDLNKHIGHVKCTRPLTREMMIIDQNQNT